MVGRGAAAHGSISVFTRVDLRSTIGMMPSSTTISSGNASGAMSPQPSGALREQPCRLGKVGAADVRIRSDELDLAQGDPPEVDLAGLIVQADEHDSRAETLGHCER